MEYIYRTIKFSDILERVINLQNSYFKYCIKHIQIFYIKKIHFYIQYDFIPLKLYNQIAFRSTRGWNSTNTSLRPPTDNSTFSLFCDFSIYPGSAIFCVFTIKARTNLNSQTPSSVRSRHSSVLQHLLELSLRIATLAKLQFQSARTFSSC